MTINIPIALLRIGHNALGAIHPMRIGIYWHLIDWERVHRIVRNLQGRIVKAVQREKDLNTLYSISYYCVNISSVT